MAKDPALRVNFNASSRPGWAYERAQKAPDTWWDATLIGEQASQLISEGRSALLVSLYDRRFKSPEEYVSRCPQFCNPISAGPALVLALRQAGRRADADRLLTALKRTIERLEAASDQDFNTELSGARLAALAGNTKDAMRRLRDAVSRGWKGQDTGFPDPESDPALDNLRKDPEFQSVLKLLRASQAAEAERLSHVDLSGI